MHWFERTVVLVSPSKLRHACWKPFDYHHFCTTWKYLHSNKVNWRISRVSYHLSSNFTEVYLKIIQHEFRLWFGTEVATSHYLNQCSMMPYGITKLHQSVIFNETVAVGNQLNEAEWRKYASPTYAIIGSDNGLSPGRRQPIIWTNAGILLIEPLGRNFSEILIAIYTFSFTKIHFKMSSGKWRPFCPGLNVLTHCLEKHTYVIQGHPWSLHWLLVLFLAPSHFINQTNNTVKMGTFNNMPFS